MNDLEIKKQAEFLRTKANELIAESVEATPGRLSEINVELTSVKAWFSEQLDDILVFKADRLSDLRKEFGNTAAAKTEWNACPQGKNEIKLRGVIGRIRDIVSVNKQRLQVKRDEAWGQY